MLVYKKPDKNRDVFNKRVLEDGWVLNLYRQDEPQKGKEESMRKEKEMPREKRREERVEKRVEKREEKREERKGERKEMRKEHMAKKR